MQNNNWVISDEYKMMIDNMSRITKTLSSKFGELYRKDSQLSSILKTNNNLEMSSTITELKNQMVNVTRFLNQLSEMFPAFQLSEEAKEFIREAKESESLSEEEFEKKYGDEFEVCRTLGEHGWVVSGHTNPRNIKNW